MDRPGGYTEIYDDTPKWKAITVLVVAGALIVSTIAAVLIMAGWLRLDERAEMALQNARAVGDATFLAKVFFWLVFWLSLAVIVGASAVSIALVLAAKARRVMRDTLEPMYFPARSRDPEIEEGSTPAPGVFRVPRKVEKDANRN